MAQKVEIDGVETEVYTAAEVQERETATRAAVEGEYKPKLEEATTKLTEAEKRAAERAGEFKQFRELNEKQVAELSEKDRIIYENTKVVKETQDMLAAERTKGIDAQVAAAITAKAGSNEKLAGRMKDMWSVIGITATTPEEIALKANMVLGALSTTEPDLVASVGTFSGAAMPPGGTKTDKGFGETEAGKAAATELGLKLE